MSVQMFANVNKTRTSACGQRIIHPLDESQGLSDAISVKLLYIEIQERISSQENILLGGIYGLRITNHNPS
jgi:hypothetical protein